MMQLVIKVKRINCSSSEATTRRLFGAAVNCSTGPSAWTSGSCTCSPAGGSTGLRWCPYLPWLTLWMYYR